MNAELELLIDRLAKEPPRGDDNATREIELAPELIDLNGVWSAGLLPAADA